MTTRVIVGDVLKVLGELPAQSVHCCVTSPPYWGLRDYGHADQIGMERTPGEYIEKIVEVSRGVARALHPSGTYWLNIGDTYAGGVESAGLPHKNLCMIPWRVASALQADGWYLRSVIAWAKKTPMPEPVKDRPVSAWEPVFLFSRQERYYYDWVAAREPSTGEAGFRNARNVWHLSNEPYPGAHFAPFPTEIPRRAIIAGTSERGCCPHCGEPHARVYTQERVERERPNALTKRTGEDGEGNVCANTTAGTRVNTTGWQAACECADHTPVPCTVLDPFLGTGTTLAVAKELGRSGVGIELNEAYAEQARARIEKSRAESPLFTLRTQ